MILVVSHKQDIHATEVIKHLSTMGKETQLLDLAQFPEVLSLFISYDAPQQTCAEIRNGTGLKVDFTRVKSTWWRRPMHYAVPEMPDSESLTFTYNEREEAIGGL